MITRRGLLKALGAVFAAPLAERVAEALPLPPPTPLQWNRFEFTGFKACVTKPNVAGQIYGQRTDGEMFFVNITLDCDPETIVWKARQAGLTTATQERLVAHVREKLRQGFVMFNSFLDPNCRCTVRIVVGHRWTEFTDEDGQLVRIQVPVYPTCEVHPRSTANA